MKTRSLLLLALLAAGCAPAAAPPPAPPPAPAPQPVSEPDPRIQIRILYVLEDGGVFRYDELASAAGKRNWCEVRKEKDETFTRYSFTLNPEDTSHWWTSL